MATEVDTIEADPLAGLGLSEADFLPPVTVPRNDERAEKRRFLKKYREIGQEVSAAIHSGVGMKTVNRWKKDKRFVKRMELTHQVHVESIIREAYRRAVIGEPRLKFHKGDVITIWNEETGKHEPYVEYKKSDRILIELLSVLDPRFRERGKSSTEINISNQNNLALGIVEDPSFYGNKAHELAGSDDPLLIECKAE